VRRREFIKQSAISVLAAGVASQSQQPEGFVMTKPSNSSAKLSSRGSFWPDGVLMVLVWSSRGRETFANCRM